ncbi:MAG TPA: radical SAM protein, partial [Planctomycetota bacterium]|nr:radical SAM protein [Planctomycetota bacterium]
MKIALVQTYHPYTQMTHLHPLGLMYVATGARRGGYEDISILDMKTEDMRVPAAAAWLEERRPDVIGLTAMTYEAGCLHSLAAEMKKRLPGVVIVAGGPHPSVAADDVMKDTNVDFCVRGEGEITFPALLDAIRAGCRDFTDVVGVVWRRENGEVVLNPDRVPPDSLDELGFPAWDLIDNRRYYSVPRGGIIYAHKEFATIFSSRACPWRCTYCHNSYGKKFRERSSRHVLEEIDMLVTKMGVRELVFYDDIFNFKPDRAKAICRGLVERKYDLKLTFPNGLRGDILDEELVDLMKDAGMYRAMIAIES